MAVTYDLQNLKRIDYAIESSGSYATNLSGSGVYEYLKVISAEMTTDQAMLDNGTMHQRMYSICPKEPGIKSCTFSLSTYLTSTETTAGNGTTQGTGSLGDLIKTTMGAVYPTTGSTIVGATSAGKFEKLSSDATDHVPGTFVAFLNSNGRLEATRVVANSSNNLTCSHNLSFTPSSGSILYGGSTYYLTQDPDKSLQFYVRGRNTSDTFIAMGCQGGFSIKVEKSALAEISFDLQGATWATGSNDTLSSPTTGGCSPAPIVVKDSEMIFTTTNTTASTPSAYNALEIASCEVTVNLAYKPIDTFGGVENVARMHVDMPGAIVSGKFVTYFANKEYWNDMDQKNFYEWQLRVGSKTGRTVVLNCPRVQITSVQRVDANGLAGVEVSWEALEPTVSQLGSYSNEDLAKSAFTISMF